jgi:hypothetical protein
LLVSGDPCGIVWIDDVCYILSASTILIILGGAWVFVRFPDHRHNLRAPRHEVLNYALVSQPPTDQERQTCSMRTAIDDLGFHVNEDERGCFHYDVKW